MFPSSPVRTVSYISSLPHYILVIKRKAEFVIQQQSVTIGLKSQYKNDYKNDFLYLTYQSYLLFFVNQIVYIFKINLGTQH